MYLARYMQLPLTASLETRTGPSAPRAPLWPLLVRAQGCITLYAQYCQDCQPCPLVSISGRADIERQDGNEWTRLFVDEILRLLSISISHLDGFFSTWT